MSGRLKTNFAGLELEHPIVAASAGTTKDAEHCFRAQEAGFSAVILKSVQQEAHNRYNPYPRFTIAKNGVPGYAATSFLCYEQAYEGDIDDYARTIREAKRRLDIPVIASINCTSPAVWEEYARACDEAGCDAMEIVPSCPAGIYMRTASEFYPIASETLKRVKRAIHVPCGVKMTQQMSNPIACATALQEDKADWVTMFNRTPGLKIDIEEMAPIMHRCACGHGGPWAILAITRWIAYAYPHLGIPISATGGVTCWQDVVNYVLAGASNVQIASLIYMKGYDVVREMLRSIEEYLDRKNVERIGDIRGLASARLQNLEDLVREGRYYAQLDSDKCTRCGKCRDICLYDAISFADGAPAIDYAKCDGCGLCAQICGRAIAIKKKPE